MRTKVSIDIDKAGGTKEIQHWADEALTDYRDEIIEDINEMVPVSGGVSHNGGGGSLQQSAFLHSDQRAQDGELTVRWDTPYARYQHGGKVMHGTPGQAFYWLCLGAQEGFSGEYAEQNEADKPKSVDPAQGIMTDLEKIAETDIQQADAF